MAGWFTPDAARDQVRIMRIDPATGERIVLPEIDVERILAEDRKELDIPLLPGDTITVDSKGIFSVFIYGEVSSPGEYALVAGMTLTQLITKAGGLKEFARTSNIRILRGGSTESPEVFNIDVDDILDGEIPDPVLKAGDVIHVDERFI
jgi:protein involved in polysaccharide export with SLBB domain